MPTALSIPMNNPRATSWDYEAGTRAGPRRAAATHTPRGKVLGGSSSINGLVYVRGNALDFDRWEAEGARAAGPMAATCCPYFRRAEDRAEGGDRLARRRGGHAGKPATGPWPIPCMTPG